MRLEFQKEGVLLSVFKGNWKSYFFCIPGQRASSEQNFEIRQSSVMSSLWLWRLFPTGDQDRSEPSVGPTHYLRGWTAFLLPLLSPLLHCPDPHTQPRRCQGKDYRPDWLRGWQPSCRLLAFFTHRLLRRKVVLNKTSKGGLALPEVSLYFSQIFSFYF